MRLSSYVDGDEATVRATEREEEVFAGDPLGPLRSLRSTSRPAFRRRRRTARRCNVHFYGRPNQAAAPVTHRRPIVPRGTVLCYFSTSFLFFLSL